MSRPLALLLIAFLAPLAAAAPVPKSLKKTASVEGTWKLIEFWSNGQKGSAEGMTPVWVLEGEVFYVGAKAEGNLWQLTIPDPARPNVRKFAHGRGSANPYPAMVEADGDTLRFCYGVDASTEIAGCAPAQNVYYYVFTRLKADDPAAQPLSPVVLPNPPK
jgi:hypothetical protein